MTYVQNPAIFVYMTLMKLSFLNIPKKSKKKAAEKPGKSGDFR